MILQGDGAIFIVGIGSKMFYRQLFLIEDSAEKVWYKARGGVSILGCDEVAPPKGNPMGTAFVYSQVFVPYQQPRTQAYNLCAS